MSRPGSIRSPPPGCGGSRRLWGEHDEAVVGGLVLGSLCRLSSGARLRHECSGRQRSRSPGPDSDPEAFYASEGARCRALSLSPFAGIPSAASGDLGAFVKLIRPRLWAFGIVRWPPRGSAGSRYDGGGPGTRPDRTQEPALPVWLRRSYGMELASASRRGFGPGRHADHAVQRSTATTINGPDGGRSRYGAYLSTSQPTAWSRTARSLTMCAVPSARTHHRCDQSSS